MTFITTNCPDCGEVEVPLESVLLRICAEDDSTAVVVCCTNCGARFVKDVDDGMSVLMVTVGVEVQTWSRPAEVDERPTHLPPIDSSELEEFAALLSNTDDASLMPLFAD